MADHGGHGVEPHGGIVTDAAEHQRVFESFMRFWVYLFSAAILALIFLALVNS